MELGGHAFTVPEASAVSATVPTHPPTQRHQQQHSPAHPNHHMTPQEPGKRLGAKAGADEIKRHPWFADINWALVRHKEPPFVIPRRSSVGGECLAVAGGTVGVEDDKAAWRQRSNTPAGSA